MLYRFWIITLLFGGYIIIYKLKVHFVKINKNIITNKYDKIY